VTRPAVTVGLPVYNGANFLDEALASLSRQTFKDFTVLVSDNASTDRTPTIAENWARRDSRIRFFRHTRNIGPIDNLCWVLEQAQTPWFTVAAHDDKWSAGYIEALYKAATAKPGIVSAAPQLVTFHGDGRSVLERQYIKQRG